MRKSLLMFGEMMEVAPVVTVRVLALTGFTMLRAPPTPRPIVSEGAWLYLANSANLLLKVWSTRMLVASNLDGTEKLALNCAYPLTVLGPLGKGNTLK